MKMVDGKTTTARGKIFTYGGKFTNNFIQGLCRDIMAEAMLRLEKEKLPGFVPHPRRNYL